MHPHDFQPLFQMLEGNPAGRRERVRNSIVDFRYLAPHKIAADEQREQEMARAALWRLQPGAGATPARASLFAVLCLRVGRALVAAGTWLQRDTATTIDSTPPPYSPDSPSQSLAESRSHASTPA